MTATAAKTPPAAATPAPRRRWPVWRWLFGALASLLLLVLILLAWVLTTQGGLRLLAEVGERALPDALEIGAVEGRLIDAFQVRDLHLRLPTLELRVGLIDLSWRPAELLGGTLSIARLHLLETEILTAPSQAPEPRDPFQLSDIRLPIAIEAEAVRAERLRLSSMAKPERPLLVLTEADISAGLSGSMVDVRRFKLVLEEPDMHAEAQGQLELRGDYPADLNLEWTFTQAPALTLKGQGQVQGDARVLRIAHRISGSAQIKLEAEVRDLLGQPAWSADIEVASLNLPQMLADAPVVDLTASLNSAGDLERATVTGHLSAEAPDHEEMGRLGAELDLAWQDQVLSIRVLKLAEQGSGAMLDAQGQVDFAHTQGQVALTGVWESLRWPLTGAARVESPRGTLEVSGQLDGFDYSLSAEVLGAAIPESRLALNGEGDQQGARIHALTLDSLGGQAIGKGTLSWSPELAWELALAAREMDPGRQWPGLDGKLGLKAESKGSLKQGYNYQLRADVGLSAYPAMVANLSGTGGTTAVEVATLAIETLSGEIKGRGTLSWESELAWEADLTLADLNPGVQYADWPGRLSGQLASQGRMTASGPELDARISDFGGQLRGYPVQVAALLELAGEHLKLRELNASSGATRLSASGQAGDTLALDFSLASPNLGELLPGAKGRLDIDGQLRGHPQAPRVTLKLSGRDVEFQGQGMASLQGETDLGLGANDPLQASLSGSNLLLGGMRFEQLNLKVEGRLPSHRLSAALKGETLSAQLSFAGQHRDQGGYRGELGQLKLATADFGVWSLANQAPVVFDQGRVEAGPLCLGDGQGSRGCVRFAQSKPGNFDASLKLERLEFSRLDPLLPANLDLNGYAVAEAAFKGRDAAIRGQAMVRVPTGAVELDLPGNSDRVDFSNANLGLVATSSGLEVKLNVPLQALGALDAQVRLPGLTLAAPDFERQALNGAIRLDLHDLSRVGELVPDVSNFAGTVNADVKLAGTLVQPVLQGRAQLNNLGFQVPFIGLSVTETSLLAQTQGTDRLDISGGANIGGGRVALTGAGSRGPKGWTIKLNLDGDKLKVADTKEYFALLKTDLSADFGPEGGSVKGLVEVKDARIMPRSIPAGTVSTSPDVIVLGQGSVSEKSAVPVTIDVAVRLLDAVQVDAFGLRGKLRGHLRAIQAPGQPLLGDGQLEILDGSYRLSSQLGLLASVGAPLKIDQGILVFAKTPLDNPGLVLRAQREGGDMTAGVRVLGTLKRPKLAFFSDSDPNMTDAEIVNYLLTGVPPQGDVGDVDRSLSVGAYIAPKLFVEYESNLGDQGDKVKLRYDLNNWIELQTETGDTQGADVFFKFEN